MRLNVPFILFLGVVGCGPTDRSQLAEEVLKMDPSFRPILEQREEYTSHIETAQREFALQRATVQRAITQLREDLAESGETLRRKKAHYKELMEPERRRLGFAVSMAMEELRAKRAQRSGIGRSISKLRKVLKEADETWSEQERKHQEAHLNEMLQDAKRLDDEVARLKDHLKLLKRKLFLIRF